MTLCLAGHVVARFNAEHKTVLDELLLGYDQIQPGKMFSFPAYYAGKKLCICLYEEGVAIKLPEASAAKLLDWDPNAKPFRPIAKSRMRADLFNTITSIIHFKP